MDGLIQSIASHRAAFLKFASGALVAFLLNVALTWVLVERAGLDYLLAYALVQLLVIINGFVFQLLVVFRRSRITSVLVIKYLSILGIVTIFKISTVRILTENAGLYYLASIVLSTGFYLIVKYVLYQRFVFVGGEPR